MSKNAQKVGWIGAGRMGAPMAERLLKAGYDVSIWNRTRAKAEPLAAKITREIAIPTIGIGASAVCDGQVLVLEDMLGLSPRAPKFVKRYTDLGPVIDQAVSAYAAEVRSRAFPTADHTYAARAKVPVK